MMCKIVVLTLLGTSHALLKTPTQEVRSAATDVQKGIAEANGLLPKFRASYAGKPIEEAAAGKAKLAAGTAQVTDGIRSLHNLAEELKSSLAQVEAEEKAELAGLSDLAKKTNNQELMKVKDHAEKELSSIAPKQEGAKLNIAQGSQKSVVGEFAKLDAQAQELARHKEKAEVQQRMDMASKLDTSMWIHAADTPTQNFWKAIFTTKGVEWCVGKHKKMHICDHDSEKQNTTVSFEDKKPLAAQRNYATRQFFKGVSQFPTTAMKMSAVESFLQKIEQEAGEKIGGRLYEHEVEHWLTNEFLIEDLNENLGGMGFIITKEIPPSLRSRDDKFKTAFKQHISCGMNWIEDMGEKGKLPKTLEYASHCGLSDDLMAVNACGEGNTITTKVGGETVNVCKDSGLDRCCAQHDLGRTTQPVSKIFHMELCKADAELAQCAAKVKPDASFVDSRGLAEKDAKDGISCLYSTLPCLAKTDFWRVDVDFSREGAPVQLIKPHANDNHHSVVFPFEDVKDFTKKSGMYREKREDESNKPTVFNIKSQ